MFFIICNRCGNDQDIYFYKGSKGYYCRKCISFYGKEVESEDIDKEVDSQYYLSFNLSDLQKDISNKLLESLLKGNSVLLEAVCGAGKTELVYKSISYYLKNKKRVGFAISRRQVVLEIALRLQEVFKNLKVVAVCQGHNRVIKGDLIVCTTHQLYRYNHYFDLLIIDEPDGFPYKDNLLLQNIAVNSCKGQIVYLTATPDDKLLNEVANNKLDYLYLPKRPTNKPLIVPKVVMGDGIILVLLLIYYCFKLSNTKTIVFVPTIKQSKRIYYLLSLFFKCTCINSTTSDKDKRIKDFKEGKYDICVATTVLERGITVKGVSVIVYKSDHLVFDEASLIQSSGRVGRDVNDDRGKCIFLSRKKSEKIDKCLQRIKKANECECLLP